MNQDVSSKLEKLNSGQYVKHDKLYSNLLWAKMREPQITLGSRQKELQFLHPQYPTMGLCHDTF